MALPQSKVARVGRSYPRLPLGRPAEERRGRLARLAAAVRLALRRVVRL
jgi:hypothetical protein